MNLNKLVQAVLSNNDLASRQMVKDAKRENFDWGSLGPFYSDNPLENALAASLTEMFCNRYNYPVPEWTQNVPGLLEKFYLDSDAGSSLPVRRMLDRGSPLEFRKRNIYTYENYLDVL